jgi:hypothetical protein
MVSGKTRTLDLPITEEQLFRYNSGELIQVAFPNLTADEREFIMTGIVQNEWDEIFPEEEETEDEAAF